MQKFSYKGLIKLGIIYTQIGGIFGLLFFTGMATFIFWGATQIQPISPYPGLMNDPRVTAVCFGIYFLLICWPFSCALINSAPTVWVTEDGILISAYLFFKIKIDWPDILFISEHKIGPFRTGHTN
jgi:hypothetical protein